MKKIFSLFALASVMLASCGREEPDRYFFDGKPAPEVLDRYLDRAVTMAGLMSDEYPDKDADIDFIVETGARFVGRAIVMWGGETRIVDQDWLARARAVAEKVHEASPDVILQGCCFEIVTGLVNEIPVPAWAFEALGLPVEERNFNRDAMLFPDGKYARVWGSENSVPDIRQKETQLWYMTLIGNYVDLGCEAVHLGQNQLVGEDDAGWKAYDAFLQKVHAYADPRARRHYVLFDAHAGDAGMFTEDGRSVLDYNAFPLRIKETPENGPLAGRLTPGFLDAMYGKYPHPYLVEFDNWGVSSHPGKALEPDPMHDFGDSIYVWGYDEISWLYALPEKERQDWLRYAYDWLKENDPYAHLQMPGTRNTSMGEGRCPLARSIAPTENVPDGMNLTGTIKGIWNGDAW